MSAQREGPSHKAIDPQVAEAAAQWFSRTTSGAFGEADRQAWMQWRQHHPAHERAWQQVESISRRFGIPPPEIGMAALYRRPAYPRRQALRSLAVVCLGAGVGWLAWRQTPWHDQVADYRTATGERREFTLPDGTRLMLDTATAVAVHFGPDERRVELLHGEIHVATALDAQRRPLIVATRFGLLQPIGTRFVVRQDDALVHLMVLEGRVQALAEGRAPAPRAGTLVHAGQRIRMDHSGISAPEAIRGSADAWTQGLLVADGLSLADFAAELSRYRPGILGCATAVAGLRLSGSFPLDDTDRALAAAARALPIRIQRLTRYWVRIIPL